MNALTIVILAIIAICGLIGYTKGFVKMLLSMLSLVVTLIVASLISPYISEALQQTPVFDSVYEKTFEYVNGAVGTAMNSSTEAIVNEMQLPDALKDYVINSEIVTAGSAPIANKIATQVAKIIFDTIVFGVTFIVALILVKIVFKMLNIITYLPLIHGANKLVGLVIGLAEGVIIVWVFFIAISMMGNSEFAANMYMQINDSAILSFLYNNNIILNSIFK